MRALYVTVRSRRPIFGASLRAPAVSAQYWHPMTDDGRARGSRNWIGLILRDVHFWVPVIVLIGGLFVLRWIH